MPRLKCEIHEKPPAWLRESYRMTWSPRRSSSHLNVSGASAYLLRMESTAGKNRLVCRMVSHHEIKIHPYQNARNQAGRIFMKANGPSNVPHSVAGALDDPGQRQDHPRATAKIVENGVRDHDHEIRRIEPARSNRQSLGAIEPRKTPAGRNGSHGISKSLELALRLCG